VLVLVFSDAARWHEHRDTSVCSWVNGESHVSEWCCVDRRMCNYGHARG
jgi:hypothetical protein